MKVPALNALCIAVVCVLPAAAREQYDKRQLINTPGGGQGGSSNGGGSGASPTTLPTQRTSIQQPTLPTSSPPQVSSPTSGGFTGPSSTPPQPSSLPASSFGSFVPQTSSAPSDSSASASSAFGSSSGSPSSSQATRASSSSVTTPVTITTPLLASSTRQVTLTVLATSDGRTFTSLATSDAVAVSTTGFATSTSVPELSGNGSGGPSGMSSSTKRVVAGVVGGIGGFIVVGALAVVAWRIWGRRKPTPEEDQLVAHSPYNSGGAVLTTEKRTSHGDGSTAYSDGLDRYGGGSGGAGHNTVNTASNF